MAVDKLTTEMKELLCDHFSLDADELDMISHVELTTDSADDVRRRWVEAVSDLSHLSRDDKHAVLQHARPFFGRIVDGCEVRMYDRVQVLKGQPRIKAVVIDLGDERFVALH